MQLNMTLVELLHLEKGLPLRKGRETQTDRRAIDKGPHKVAVCNIYRISIQRDHNKNVEA